MNSVTFENGQLVIRTQYDPELVAQIRQLPQRRWDPTTKAWYVPPRYNKEVEQIAKTFNIEYTIEEDFDYIENLPTVTVTYQEETFVIYFNYDLVILEKIRGIPRARYSAIMGGWTAPKESAVEVLQFADNVSAIVDPSCEEVLKEAKEESIQIEASRATTSTFEVEGLGGTLMPFQRAGVEYAVKAKRLFIADEMGLGKTVQGLATIFYLNAFPCVIVGPASLKTNWYREIKKWLPNNLRTVILQGRQGTVSVASNADILIVNYDILDYWLPKLGEIKGLIVDESHYCKNPKAKRTKAVINLADKVTGPVLCLTGTPVLNNPTELLAQLRIIGRLKDFGGAKKFRDEFSSTRHLPELNRRLRASMYVRRRKVDVLTELPPKRWSDVIVEPSADAMKRYREAERDLISYLAAQAQENATKAGATTVQAREAALIATMKAQAAEQLVAVNTLKRLSADAKFHSAVEWIENFLKSDNKLIIFTWHTQLAKRLAEHFNVGLLTGETPLDQRAHNVDTFQKDPTCRLFISTMKAGGVGLTLTAASDVLFLEQGWTPADMEQAADRAHRIGQQDSVTAWLLLIENTIDEDIRDLIAYKRQLVDASTDGTKLQDKQNILTDLLVRLAKRGLNGAL